MAVNRDELLRTLSLFFLAAAVVGVDPGAGATFPASVLLGLATLLAHLTLILAPSYLAADLLLVVRDRLSPSEADAE